ncbi:kelch-like protein 10 [Epinephelus fuscoguttatus]|uniref:kelch-like protein 10 n=1 Tax=Epinephelus fuscoguttatus TaxID=293821 RepID=UPI0020D1D3D1|nr:kelch-like protein 10 [Epinephelus fuscoguttatus]
MTFYNTINELRLEDKLCDAVIRVDGVDFNVHMVILCSCSSYFRDLFRGKTSTSEQQVYTFSQVSPTTMSLILDYAYTGLVVVTEENVLELLAGADHFAIKGIVQACCNLLEQQLNYKSCVHIWMLAGSHKCTELRQKAYLYILHHFEEVTEHSEKLLQLSVGQMADLIEKDELNVRQESAVFETILRWINYAPEERRGHMATLLSKVRLLLMSSKYLVNTVMVNALVMKSPLCRTMVIHTLNTLLKSKTRRPLTRTRLPSAVLLAIGGWMNDAPTNRIHLYNVRADSWVTVNNSREAPRMFHGCVFLNGFVYCVGGYDGFKYLRSVRKLDLVTQTWQNVGSMRLVRCYVSVVALDGCIYAMGGCNKSGRLKTAERYQPDTSQWTLIAPMHEYRSNASATTLHGKVYICGGFNWAEPLSTAECYDPHANQWTLITPMGNGYDATLAIAYKDQIYVVGGLRETSHTSRVIAYDPQSNQWSMVNHMINPRSSFGIAVLEDQLYVVGGLNDYGIISKVERYDEKTNAWSVVQDMEVPCSDLSCCVVERCPFTAAYLS